MNNPLFSRKLLFVLLVVVILFNLVLLNYLFFFKTKPSDEEVVNVVSPSPTISLPKSDNVETELASCPQACLDLMSSSAGEAGQISPTVGFKDQEKEVLQGLVKEVFVPLGSGQFQGSDWQLLSGTQTTIDSRLYQGIKSVFLQASFSIPNAAGKVEASLFNLTDGYDVWGSQLESQGSELKMISSGSFELPQGQKDYQLKVRSSIGSPAAVGLARLRIILK